MSLLDKLKNTDFKTISEPQEIFPIENTKTKQNEPTKINNDVINTPIRVMMSIVTQLKMFDINSNGLTPKGRNKKELKTEIIDLVSKLSEK